jgi:uncharacterized protein Yka (UPF0111/DUF47 family)
MARICGNSESAYALAQGLNTAFQTIESALDECESAANQIRGAWRDSGSEIVDELISSVKSAINNAAESIPNLKQAVEEYARFLESTGR